MEDVWEYFERRRREAKAVGLELRDDVFAEESGSNGVRGRIWGRVEITERTFLNVSERVEVVDGTPHRTE